MKLFLFELNLFGVLYLAIFSCGKLLRRVLNEKREIYWELANATLLKILRKLQGDQINEDVK